MIPTIPHYFTFIQTTYQAKCFESESAIPIFLVYRSNTLEIYRRDNSEKLADRVHTQMTNKTQAQHNMRWTPLYANKHN
jgi:hypothetical protein